MAGDPRQCALEQCVGQVSDAHAATQAVRHGDHTVDVGVGSQALRSEVVGDLPGGVGRAIDRRDDSDHVARARPSRRTLVAEECAALSLGHDVHWLRIHTEDVVVVQIAHRQVMGVYVVAGPDVGGCEADRVTVAADGRARWDCFQRNLVAARYGLSQPDLETTLGTLPGGAVGPNDGARLKLVSWR